MVCPTVPPKVIRALPLFMVSARAPSIVVVAPLKTMAASLDVKVMAPVDSVIGPV